MRDLFAEDPFLAEELESVKGIIAETIRSPDPLVSKAIGDLSSAGGKMLRPALLLISAGFGKYKPEIIRPLAAAIEILHLATLVHDDVIDDSPLRRGLPSAHIRLGRKDAVLVGDFLFSRCFLLAAERSSPENAKRIARAMNAICMSEIEQDSRKFLFDASARGYYRKTGGKTAVLFSLACHSGATEAKAKPEIVETLRRTGWELGIAFQIVDDILDYEGSEGRMRKSVGRDLSEGLCTLPLVYALRFSGPSILPLLSREKIAAGSVPDIIAAVRSSGGIEAARKDAVHHTERAIREIVKLPRGSGREILHELLSSLLSRDF
jgi:heptaprenyl diphosphate synthase